MIIIPFIHKVKYVSSMMVTMFQFLTVGGSHVWEEEDPSLDLERDILHPNGIFLLGSPIKYKDAYLCPVDTTKTNLSEFYQWSEVSPNNSDTFCWRTLYLTGEKTNYRGWLPIPNKERIGPYAYQEILDTLNLNAHDV